MEHKEKRKIGIIVIVGPTASGKSDLAIKLAKKYNGEIISADSRQVYRGMDIGTGKVSKQEQKMVHHYLIDVTSPKKQFTVDDFKRLGEKAINDIASHYKLPIIVGGTGLYVDTLVYDREYPAVAPNQKLRNQLNKLTIEQLNKRLGKLDPERAKTIDPKNKRRLIRALEIIKTTGQKVPKLSPSYYHDRSDVKVIWLGLNPPKELLAKKIKKRLKKWFKQGLIKEVESLKEKGVSWKRLESFGLSYYWVAQFLQNKVTSTEMKTGLLRDIIRYSKRQMTWFKRNKNIKWLTF